MDTQRVVIVGGGVLGTMHALEACRRGWEVVHLEADAGPRRASVRNFGLVWVSGRAAGPELALALRARELWEELAAHSPAVGFRPDGSLTVARHEAELALMAEAGRPARRRRPGASSCSTPAGVRAANPAVRGSCVGGLLLPPRRRRRARAGAGRAAGHPRGHRPLHVAPPSPGRRRRHVGGRPPWPSTTSAAATRARSSSCASATGSPGSAAGSGPPWPRRRCGAAGSR